MMMAEERMDVFLSCFKCGRIVRAGDSECPRCGLQFGPGTLFECPFCSGLVWRNASKCSTCGTDLAEFSISVERTFAGFDMDEFVENIINTELEQLRSSSRKVACPGCGLMIRGDEEKCPRCDLPLGDVSVVCPVCGEKMAMDVTCCPNCKALFTDDEIREVSAEAGEAPGSSVGQASIGAEATAPRAKTSRPRKKVPAKKKPAAKPPAKKKIAGVRRQLKTKKPAKKKTAGKGSPSKAKKTDAGKKRPPARGKGAKKS
jgi:RNA polymerase subunit RPABC4/transcription elongation factor Spt4